LDAQNRADKEALFLVGHLVGPCQSLEQKFHHSGKTEPRKDFPCRLELEKTVQGRSLLMRGFCAQIPVSALAHESLLIWKNTGPPVP